MLKLRWVKPLPAKRSNCKRRRFSRVLHFHKVLRKRNIACCSLLGTAVDLAPKDRPKALIQAVVERRRRNPKRGCPRIAQSIALAFGVEIDREVVRRILQVHYQPDSGASGPSWLTFLGHAQDSLSSCDLFRCESATLRAHWVLVVMD
jgi:hypothetical protein